MVEVVGDFRSVILEYDSEASNPADYVLEVDCISSRDEPRIIALDESFRVPRGVKLPRQNVYSFWLYAKFGCRILEYKNLAIDNTQTLNLLKAREATGSEIREALASRNRH
jgi:hypothetical protein